VDVSQLPNATVDVSQLPNATGDVTFADADAASYCCRLETLGRAGCSKNMIAAQKNENCLFISSAIDNLLRGASSQALVAANILMGLDESLGAPKIAYVP